MVQENSDDGPNDIFAKIEKPPGFDDDDEELSNTDYIPTSRFGEAAKEIGNVVACLYRLSITIQNPSSREKLEKMEKIDMTFFETFDTEHIRNKFGIIRESGGDWLLERLGKSNTKRRQILRYHETHHEKIVGLRIAQLGAEEGEAPEVGMSSGDFYSVGPSTVQTTVSTVYQQNQEYDLVNPIDLDSRSEAGCSQTSYASSTNSGKDVFRVPPPPQGFDSGPFQCPYCFRIVETTNKNSWK
jgi:hypothetical protein